MNRMFVERSIHIVRRLLEDGTIDELRINASVRRILRLKEEACIRSLTSAGTSHQHAGAI